MRMWRRFWLIRPSQTLMSVSTLTACAEMIYCVSPFACGAMSVVGAIGGNYAQYSRCLHRRIFRLCGDRLMDLAAGCLVVVEFDRFGRAEGFSFIM